MVDSDNKKQKCFENMLQIVSNFRRIRLIDKDEKNINLEVVRLGYITKNLQSEDIKRFSCIINDQQRIKN